MKNTPKLKVGDLILITGPAHYEKATVIKVEKNVVTLDNQMKIDHEFNNLTKTSMVAEPWNQDKFDILHAKRMMEPWLFAIQSGWRELTDEAIVAIEHKLSKIIEKYNIKKV